MRNGLVNETRFAERFSEILTPWETRHYDEYNGENRASLSSSFRKYEPTQAKHDCCMNIFWGHCMCMLYHSHGYGSVIAPRYKRASTKKSVESMLLRKQLSFGGTF